MRKNRKYDWPQLIKEFESSNMTQTQFCSEKDINPRYFSQRRSKHLNKENPPFIQIESDQASFEASKGLSIEVGRCKIHCPQSMPVESFAALVHSLS